MLKTFLIMTTVSGCNHFRARLPSQKRRPRRQRRPVPWHWHEERRQLT